jgi:Protein of unknown function, DUF547
MITKRAFAQFALSAAAAATLAGAQPVAAADAIPTFKKVSAGSAATVDHGVWDKLLKQYVVVSPDGVNRVAYASLKKDQGALKGYLAALQKVDPSTLDKAEQFAFWVNLYNAKTIDVVLDKYPVKSIKDISLGGGLKTLITGGPWQAKIMKVSGIDLTLDDVENAVLRPIYGDNRVHYAVNCASIGCPNLANEAWTGAKLEAMLETGAKAFINSPRGVLIEGDRIKASSIYDWFKADFGGNEASVIAHLNKYATAELKARINKIGTISSYDYDWVLADAKK